MGDLERLVIHIGMPKTGTTALQDTFDANRVQLAACNVHYPRTGLRGHAHHPIAWSAALDRRPRDDVAPLPHYLDSLAAELKEASGIAILSSEAIFHLPANELRRIVEWGETQARSQLLIVYVRAPAAFHEGWYRQLVKTSHYELTFQEHLDSAPIVNTLARLVSAESVVRREQMIVRPYVRSFFPGGDVVADFCAETGVGAQCLNDRETNPNPSLGADVVELKVQLHKIGVGHCPRLAAALLDWSSRRSQSERSLFTLSQWEAFSASTRAPHSELLNRYELPDALIDERPPELTRESLSIERARSLLHEFRDHYPAVARDCIGDLELA